MSLERDLRRDHHRIRLGNRTHTTNCVSPSRVGIEGNTICLDLDLYVDRHSLSGLLSGASLRASPPLSFHDHHPDYRSIWVIEKWHQHHIVHTAPIHIHRMSLVYIIG